MNDRPRPPSRVSLSQSVGEALSRLLGGTALSPVYVWGSGKKTLHSLHNSIGNSRYNPKHVATYLPTGPNDSRLRVIRNRLARFKRARPLGSRPSKAESKYLVTVKAELELGPSG